MSAKPKCNPSDAYKSGRSAMRYAAAQHGTVNLSPSTAQRDEWRGPAWKEFIRGWNDEKRAKVNPSDASEGVKFVLGIVHKTGKRVSEVQSVLFDKAKWAVSDAKKWLKSQGFKVPSADETANFLRFRQKSPARYKEMRTIEAGAHRNPEMHGRYEHPSPKRDWKSEVRTIEVTNGQEIVRLQLRADGRHAIAPDGEPYVYDGKVWRDITDAEWTPVKGGRRHRNTESIPESLTGHLALTSDPFFRTQPPEIQAAMMTGMDLAERVKQNPAYGQVKSRGWSQEWYETKSGDARKRASGLRKIGYRVSVSSGSPQVTPVGTVNMTLVTIGPGSTGDKYLENVPETKVVRLNPWTPLTKRESSLLLRRIQKAHPKDSYASDLTSWIGRHGGGLDTWAYEYGIRKQHNPSEAEAAAELSEKFHGRPAKTVTTISEEVLERENFTELGNLIEMKLRTLSGYDVVLQFSQVGKKMVKLCSSPDGKQLYFIGGDQSVPLEQIHMGSDKWKRDRMILGILGEVTYRTAKGFDKFQLLDYFHKLGEETKQKPMLEYDTLNDQLSVSGGQYQVKHIGLVN